MTLRLDLRDRGDAAVDREHKVESLLGQPRQRARVQPVALLEARRQVPRHIRVELAEKENGKRGRADAVGVVVAVDADPRSTRDGGADCRDGVFHVPERQRIVAGQLPVEEAPCLVDVAMAAPREHRRGRLRDAERLRQGLHVGVRALLELPGSGRHGVNDGTDGVGRPSPKIPGRG